MPCHFFGGCRLHGDFKQLAVFASRLSSSCQPIGVSIFNPNEAVVEIHSSPGVQAVNLQKAAGKEDGNLSKCFQFRNLASKETFQISMCFYELQNNCWCFQIYQHSSIYMIGIFFVGPWVCQQLSCRQPDVTVTTVTRRHFQHGSSRDFRGSLLLWNLDLEWRHDLGQRVTIPWDLKRCEILIR